jgi:hypothetical protein
LFPFASANISLFFGYTSENKNNYKISATTKVLPPMYMKSVSLDVSIAFGKPL